MDFRRREASKALQDSRVTAGHRDATDLCRSLTEGGATIRDVVVAGGLRGFTPEQMFAENAA